MYNLNVNIESKRVSLRGVHKQELGLGRVVVPIVVVVVVVVVVAVEVEAVMAAD